MINLIFVIANITGGILLGLATLDKWDGEKDYFNKIAKVLAPFQTIIGGVLVVVGFLNIFRGGSVSLLMNVLSLVGGFLLLTHVLGKAPAFKDTLLKISNKLMPFKAIIGIALLVIGVLRLF